jgi:hypothetical protein
VGWHASTVPRSADSGRDEGRERVFGLPSPRRPFGPGGNRAADSPGVSEACKRVIDNAFYQSHFLIAQFPDLALTPFTGQSSIVLSDEYHQIFSRPVHATTNALLAVEVISFHQWHLW